MMDNTVDQIKERLSITDLIGEYVKLERAGVNFKACCPFHNEKTPSFMVNPERNFWYCFGCQKGGDAFSFLMEMEGIDFRQALERLAEKTGVELPRFDPQTVKKRSVKQRLFSLMEDATIFYQAQLKGKKGIETVIPYLNNRNITSELIKLFRIGFAPEGWTHVIDFLKKRDFKEDEIEKAGLLVRKQGSSGSNGYDRFRDRIMLPVQDINGKVVGFSARVAPGGDESNAKYINTPQTELYDKSAILYGLYQAKTAIRSKDSVIVVEGNLDVIASAFAGVDNVVAISGTALTTVHANILKRYTRNVKLCFDMDEAGQRATKKSIQTCLRSDLDVEIILLPHKQKDVCDLVGKDKNEWIEASQGGIPVMEYYFKKGIENYDSDDVRTKKVVARNMLNLIRNVADPIEQSYWLKKLAQAIEIDEEVLTRVLEKGSVEKKREQDSVHDHAQNDSEPAENKKKSRRQMLEERLMGLISLYPNELIRGVENLRYDFTGENETLWEKVKSKKKMDSNDPDEYAMKVKYICDEKQGLIEQDIDPTKEWEKAIIDLEDAVRQEEIETLRRDIQRAKDEGDEQAFDLLMGALSGALEKKNKD